MKKLLSLLGVGMLVAMWSGCGITNPVGAPTVEIDAIGSIAIGTNNVSKTVTGKIKADTAISSITAVIETSAGVAVPSTQIEVTTPAGNGQKTQDLTATSGIVLVIKSAAVAGAYKLKITVVAGATTTVSFDFALTGNGGTAVTTSQPIVMGSYKNANLGSSIDLDNGTVMFSAAAKAANSGVDLVGTVSDAATMRIFTPTYAASGSGITAFANWNTPANTSIVQVSGTTFNAITTAEQIESLYNAGTSATAFTANVGDVFVVKTDQGKFVAVEITAHDADNTGTFTLKYAK